MKSAVFEFFAEVFNIASGDLNAETFSLRERIASVVAQLYDEGQADGSDKKIRDDTDNNDYLIALLRFYLFCLLKENAQNELITPSNLEGFDIIYQSLPSLVRELVRRQNDVILQSIGKDPEILLVLYIFQQSLEAKKEGNNAYHSKYYVLAVRRYLRAIRYLERLQKLHYRLFSFASSYGHPSLPQPSWEDGNGSRKRERTVEEDDRATSLQPMTEIHGDDCGSDDNGGSNGANNAGAEDIVSDENEGDASFETSSGISSDEAGDIVGESDQASESSHFESLTDDDDEDDAPSGIPFLHNLSPMAARIIRSSGILQRLLAGLAPPVQVDAEDDEGDEAEYENDGDHVLGSFDSLFSTDEGPNSLICFDLKLIGI